MGFSGRSVILLAESDPILLVMFRKMLDKDEHVVLIAADGREAVEVSRNYEGIIDLLLTDTKTRFLDGLSCYHQISSERPGMKVLFMAASLPDQFPRSLPVIKKPFHVKTLLSHISELLRASH